MGRAPGPDIIVLRGASLISPVAWKGDAQLLLRDLPVGTRIRERESGILFLLGEHEHPGYRGTTLITNNVIGQACLDAPEVRNPKERLRLTGSNYYPFSNIHQWLNAEGSNWFSPAHEYDEPPTKEAIATRPNIYDRHGYNSYAQKPGFLSWFSPAFREALYESDVPCTNAAQDGIEFVKAKVFLPSTDETGMRTSNPLKEGSRIAVFADFRMRYASPSADAVSISEWQPAYFNTESLFWYWLRTPKGNDDGFTHYAHTCNPFSYKFSCCPWIGIRPVLTIESALSVKPSPNRPDHYLFG